MSTDESSKKKSHPQLATLDKAFKLAEQWVDNMSKSSEDNSNEVKLEGRPPRLGLGATVPRQAKVELSKDPVERRLRAKLDAEHRKVSKSNKESAPSARNQGVDEDDSDEELESRSNAFVKKRPVVLTSSLQAKKQK